MENCVPVKQADLAEIAIKKMRELAAGKSVEEVESIMLAQEQVPAPVIHRFGPGIYIRELTLPAGTFAIGHHQRFEHMNVMLKGRVTMINDNGSVTELVAPMVFVGKPGRKIGYIHEEMVWQNIYATTETDIETLEAQLLEKSESWVSDNALRGIDTLRVSVDRSDYTAMLSEFGIAEEVASAQSQNTSDFVSLPLGGYKAMVADSKIHGKGLFATAPILSNEVIAPARINGMRTQAGRFTNHSANPNARMVMLDNGDIDLVASLDIKGCSGGQNGDEITIDYRQALSLSGIRSLTCQQ